MAERFVLRNIFGEFQALLKLALPVSLAQLSLVGMSATDVLIAGNASTVDLAGMNLGANIWHMVALFFMSIGVATQPLVAHAFGAQDDVGIKEQMQQSIWLCCLLGILCVCCVVVVAFFTAYLDYEENMLAIARNYLLVMSLCAVPYCLQPALRGTLEGLSFTPIVFVINFTAFLLNIPLDYVLVNGLYGFPRLGGVGCAWATVILVWLMLLAMALNLKFHPQIRWRALFSQFAKPRYAQVLRTWKLGFPIGLAVLIELSMFCGAGMLIAWFGPVEAGAHAVAITVASISFMLYNGLAQGVTIRASQFLGAQRPGRALYSVKVGISFNLLIASAVCVSFLLFDREIIELFSNDPAVIEVAIVLLMFGAVFQIGDSLQVAVVYALRAYQDTVTPSKVMFIGFWLVGLPLGIALAFYDWWPEMNGAKGLWTGMVGSLFLVGGLLLWHLVRMVQSFDQADFDQEEMLA